MTTAEYLLEWYAQREISVQRSTYESEYTYVTRHLAPYFGQISLPALKPLHISRYAKDKLSHGRLDHKPGGLSLVSVRKHISVLKQALDDAVVAGYIPSNPAAPVRLPRRKSGITKRAVLLSPTDAKKVIAAFDGHPLYPAVVIALYYGLRRSEVLGLKWTAIDFTKDTIRINHTVVKNRTVEAKDRTKTETSARTFQLLPEVKNLLMELPHYSPYIFAWSDGRLYRPDYVTRSFQRVLRAARLPRMRFHDLRHSTASILFDRGWSLEDVKQWLGHADIETTSNVYLHYNQGRKVLVANSLTGLLIGK